MRTIAKLTPADLKRIIRESVMDTLSRKKLKGIHYEVIEDIAMKRAIDEGMRTESIDAAGFVRKLKSRCQ